MTGHQTGALELPSAVLWITTTGLDEIGLSRDPQALPRIRKHSRVNGHYGVYEDVKELKCTSQLLSSEISIGAFSASNARAECII
jgi:hypothetical protein